MLKIIYTNKFKKDYKTAVKRGYDITKLGTVISLLAAGTSLPEHYKDHNLKGDWEGFRECHVEPDWLLIYTINQNDLILTLTRTGTHSDLFKS